MKDKMFHTEPVYLFSASMKIYALYELLTIVSHSLSVVNRVVTSTFIHVNLDKYCLSLPWTLLFYLAVVRSRQRAPLWRPWSCVSESEANYNPQSIRIWRLAPSSTSVWPRRLLPSTISPLDPFPSRFAELSLSKVMDYFV